MLSKIRELISCPKVRALTLLHLHIDYTLCKRRLVTFKDSVLFQPSIKQSGIGDKNPSKSTVTSGRGEGIFYLMSD